MDNLEEMDKFLETCNLPKPNQEKIENMNRWITNNETASVILKKPKTHNKQKSRTKQLHR